MPEKDTHAKLDALQRQHEELALRSKELESTLEELEREAKKTSGQIRLPEITPEIRAADPR